VAVMITTILNRVNFLSTWSGIENIHKYILFHNYMFFYFITWLRRSCMENLACPMYKWKERMKCFQLNFPVREVWHCMHFNRLWQADVNNYFPSATHILFTELIKYSLQFDDKDLLLLFYLETLKLISYYSFTSFPF
jgi:hypothetical protein